MEVEFLALKKYLQGNAPRCVAVYGNDSYITDKAVCQIRDSLMIEFPELNIAEFGAGADANSVIAACEAMPFMSPLRMVIVKDFSIPKAYDEKIKFQDYFYKPSETACLVLCLKEKPKANELGIDGILCDKLKMPALVSWIAAKAKQSNRRITAANAEKIAEYCLHDMSRISRETEKLCVFCEDEITADAIESLVEKDSEYIVWELGQEISLRHSDKALAIAKNLLGNGEEITSLVSSVYSLFRRMFYSVISALPMSELALKLGVKEYAVKKTRETAESFTHLQLKKALELCRKADEDIKCVNSDKTNTFYWLILSLLNLKEQKA